MNRRNTVSSGFQGSPFILGLGTLALLGANGCSPDVSVLQSRSDVSGTGGSATGSDAATATGATAGSTASGPDGATPALTTPIDMYVMLDRSSSMLTTIDEAGTTRWSLLVSGLEALATNPAVAGAGVGIQYFPLNGIAPASCSAPYDVPDVEIAPLPSNAAALRSSLEAQAPTDFTPTAPALQGALNHMKDWAPAHPGRTPVVALVTDGFATECDPFTTADITAIAAAGFTPSIPVRTFVIGVGFDASGGDISNLDPIARAGGTGHVIDVEGDVATSLAAALANILTGDGG